LTLHHHARKLGVVAKSADGRSNRTAINCAYHQLSLPAAAAEQGAAL
jgi:hypothetical protein